MTTGSWTVQAQYNTSSFGGGDTISGIRGWADDAPYFARDASGQNDLISSRDGRIMYNNWLGPPYIATVVSAVFTPDVVRYDCINGQCVSSSTYNTSGVYATLTECQANCGSGSRCNPPNICAPPDYCPLGMVCIPSEEWNQIEPLSSAVKGKACG